MTKALTGIPGFDAMTGGGLPSGSATLVQGGAGAGKTIFALQALVHGATVAGEPGIFVAFEEDSARILAHAASFAWGSLDGWEDRGVWFIDAQPDPDLVRSGSFDLAGLLAAVGAKAQAVGARRIVFDGLDIVLAFLPSAPEVRRELFRVHRWLQNRGLTAILTSKGDPGDPDANPGLDLGFLSYVVDCAVQLRHEVIQGTSQRSVRVSKYRGSAFDENEAAMTIGDGGLQVSGATRETRRVEVTTERVSSGVERLDAMLGGGYFRGSSVLLTGVPGTAKTTLCGAFAAAATARGEPTTFVSFDSPTDEIIRDLGSVAIDLETPRRTGILQMVDGWATSGSAELHLLRIMALVRDHGSRCLIIDPLSALAKAGNAQTSLSVVQRLVDEAHRDGITLVVTSLLDGGPTEGTPIQVSTVADTWIHLDYRVLAGERNRGLSIVKSRGTWHSNQVRELVLAADGVSLANVYTAGGAVLMGTARWEREEADRIAARAASANAEQRRLELQVATERIDADLARLNRERASNAAILASIDSAAKHARADATDHTDELAGRRGADIPDMEPLERDDA